MGTPLGHRFLDGVTLPRPGADCKPHFHETARPRQKKICARQTNVPDRRSGTFRIPLISGVDEGVRQRPPGGERGVGAAHDVLTLVPDHGAGAAVKVHGLHTAVLEQDVGAGVDARADDAVEWANALVAKIDASE